MTTQLGLGVMIQQLGGNAESVKAFKQAVGQTITGLKLENDALHIEFASGYQMTLEDEGQSCCEHRYMRTDDNLDNYIGATLLDAEVNPAAEISDPESYEVHEVEFLIVRTSKGAFTMASHNEHNGYYGGFCIRAKGSWPK